jgi:hypothetical protein
MSAKESPSPASDQKPECIPYTIVILRKEGDIVAKYHKYQIYGSNNAVPQTTPEAIRMTAEAGSYNFLIGTSREEKYANNQE